MLFMAICSLTAMAQTDDNNQESASSQSQSATVATPDATPETTTPATPQTSQRQMRGNHRVAGYRIQVYAGGATRADKQRAQKAGHDVKRHYPNQPVYVHFKSPRWVCHVGNFRRPEDARTMLKNIRALGYPAAVIVKGQVNARR